MCSIAAQRIAEIGKAIDDLATKASPAAKGEPAEASLSAAKDEAGVGLAAIGTDPIVARVAELWALLAELDPEMSKRLAGYRNLSTPTDLWPTAHVKQSRRPDVAAHWPRAKTTPTRRCRQGSSSGTTLPPETTAWQQPWDDGAGWKRGLTAAASAADDFDLKHGADLGVQPN